MALKSSFAESAAGRAAVAAGAKTFDRSNAASIESFGAGAITRKYGADATPIRVGAFSTTWA